MSYYMMLVWKKAFGQFLEAVSTAAYLLNRTPHEKLDGKSPREVWSGHEQNLSYLKVFECVAMMMKPSLSIIWSDTEGNVRK